MLLRAQFTSQFPQLAKLSVFPVFHLRVCKVFILNPYRYYLRNFRTLPY